MDLDYKKHYSVLNKEVINFFKDSLTEQSSLQFSDLTFGAGGHTFEILDKIPKSTVMAFDQDIEAFENGLANIKSKKYEDRIVFFRENFSQFKKKAEGKLYSGIIADLGVSSHHFDKGERGFSFRFDHELDMRMDHTNKELPKASDLLLKLSEEKISYILKTYGEERFADRIAKKVIEKRESGNPILRTKELEDLVFHSYPKKMRFGKTSVATKTFQALRIAVNNELGVIEDVIPDLAKSLEVGGVLAIITFHSLEDRIVKQQFKEIFKGDIPVEILTKRPILPSFEEINENSRSRSAKLRVLKRVKVKKTKNKYQVFSKGESIE